MDSTRRLGNWWHWLEPHHHIFTGFISRWLFALCRLIVCCLFIPNFFLLCLVVLCFVNFTVFAFFVVIYLVQLFLTLLNFPHVGFHCNSVVPCPVASCLVVNWVLTLYFSWFNVFDAWNYFSLILALASWTTSYKMKSWTSTFSWARQRCYYCVSLMETSEYIFTD